MPESESQAEPKSACKACGTPMPRGAPLCPTCKSFQSRWKRQLQFYASTVALFIASASLLAWLGSTLPNLRRNLMPRDHLRVVSCNSADSIVVFNDGDRDLFVSHVLLYMSGRDSNWRAPRFSVQAVVPSGQFHRHELPHPRDIPNGEFVRGVQEPQWQQLLSRAVENSQCFNLYFFAQDDTFYKELSQMAGPHLNTFPVGAYVEYLAPGSSTPNRAEFPAVGVVQRDLSSTCQ